MDHRYNATTALFPEESSFLFHYCWWHPFMKVIQQQASVWSKCVTSQNTCS